MPVSMTATLSERIIVSLPDPNADESGPEVVRVAELIKSASTHDGVTNQHVHIFETPAGGYFSVFWDDKGNPHVTALS